MKDPKLLQPEVSISNLQEGESFAMVCEGWGQSFPTRYGKVKRHGVGTTLVYWQDEGDKYVAPSTLVNRVIERKPKTKKRK